MNQESTLDALKGIEESTEESSPTSLKHPQRSYAFLLTSNFLWFFGLGLYMKFLSLFLIGIGATPIDAGFFSSVMMASGILWTGLGGIFTTRFGVKPLLILGWLIIIPAPIIYILAQYIGWQWALLGAFFEGTALLASAPFRTYTSHVMSRKRQGFAYSLIASSSAIAFIPSPTIGGLLITWLGYSNLFVITVILFLISTLLLFPLSSVQRIFETGKRRWQGDFLKSRVFILTIIFMGVLFSIYTLTDFFIPLFLFERFGLDEVSIGILFTISNASGAILGPILGIAGDRWGHVKILIIPVIGSIGYYFLLVLLPSPVLLPLAYAVQGLSFGGYILTNAIISHKVHPTQLPNAFAVFVLASRAISPFTPFIGGITYVVQPEFPIFASVLLLPVNFFILYLLHRANKPRGKEQSQKADEING